MKLTTQQIGKLGELLVQYKLLLHGVESAPMTTDTGIDLVAFANKGNKVKTIQVKTQLKPTPGGGKGKPSISWWVPQNTPANLFAFVDLSADRVWLLTFKELEKLAQQKPEGRFHLYMYIDPNLKPRKRNRLIFAYEFEKYILENRVEKLFSA
jgi:hypothetical protein